MMPMDGSNTNSTRAFTRTFKGSAKSPHVPSAASRLTAALLRWANTTPKLEWLETGLGSQSAAAKSQKPN